MRYLLLHNPIVSSPIKETVKHNCYEASDIIDEAAVFKLENGKYAYVRYSGSKDNLGFGVTDLEEFETKEEAIKVFESFI